MIIHPTPRPTQVIYKSVSGCKIHMDIHHGLGEGKRPCLMWIHGGGLVMGSRHMIDENQLQAYLANGYTIVAIDYRLAPETKADQIIEDVVDGFHWLSHNASGLGINAERIGVIGHSAGGYLALSLGTIVKTQLSAVVMFYGYGDLSADWAVKPSEFYGTMPMAEPELAMKNVHRGLLSQCDVADRQDYYFLSRRKGTWVEEVTGVSPDALDVLRQKYSPLFRLTSELPAILLIHGDKDQDVPVEESYKLHARLQHHGVPCILDILRGYGHVFDTDGDGMKNPRVAASFERVVGFLRQQV